MNENIGCLTSGTSIVEQNSYFPYPTGSDWYYTYPNWYWTYPIYNPPCPNCGYCPHCGRGNDKKGKHERPTTR
jgi:hypothetical protein